MTALDPTKIPKGLSPEVTPDRKRNPKGVYFHKASGKRLTALSVPAADAFRLQGFVYEGPADAESAPSKKAAKSAATSDPEKDKLKEQLAAAQKATADAKAAQKVAEDAATKATADAAAAKGGES